MEAVTKGLAAKSRCSGKTAMGAVVCMHNAWLQRERLVDKAISKDLWQWMLAMDVEPWLQTNIEAQHCLWDVSSSAATQLRWGNHASGRWCREAVGVQVFRFNCLCASVASSSSSSVGVMQVEDTRRVTQVALVIVDDSWWVFMMICVYSFALKYVNISSLARSRSKNRAFCNTSINNLWRLISISIYIF